MFWSLFDKSRLPRLAFTFRPPKNLTCQPRNWDCEDTESITTPISTSDVSDPNSYHVTESPSALTSSPFQIPSEASAEFGLSSQIKST